MTKYFFIIAFTILTFSAKSQIINDSILIEGHYRTFHFLKPARANASLIFVLHGSGGNGLQNRGGAKKIEAIAPAENILLVYPDGYKRFWNECRKTANSAANLENINENAFFSLMIEYFEKHYKINSKKIFAVGTSGGGHMAYKLGLTMPEKFRAITAIIANLPDTNNIDCIEKHVPIPVMIINGTADKTNPYEGGEVIIQNNLSLGFVRSTNRTFDYWSSLAGYKGSPKMESLPDNDPNDGKTIERYTFREKNKIKGLLTYVCVFVREGERETCKLGMKKRSLEHFFLLRNEKITNKNRN
jgi:polyhydroxybutyrate depolymerase